MSWINVGVAAAGMIAKSQQAKNANANKQAQNRAAAEQTRYSAWSGFGPGQIDTNMQDVGAAAISGGASGLSIAQGLGKFGAKPDSNVVPTGGETMNAGPNYLGGQDYANQMGSGYSSWNFNQPQMASVMPTSRKMNMSPMDY